MDDDWLADDSEIDVRANEIVLMQNELDKIWQREHNQGYLDGVEWANENYSKVQFREDAYYRQLCDQGIEEGIALANKSERKLSMIAKLL